MIFVFISLSLSLSHLAAIGLGSAKIPSASTSDLVLVHLPSLLGSWFPTSPVKMAARSTNPPVFPPPQTDQHTAPSAITSYTCVTYTQRFSERGSVCANNSHLSYFSAIIIHYRWLTTTMKGSRIRIVSTLDPRSFVDRGYPLKEKKKIWIHQGLVFSLYYAMSAAICNGPWSCPTLCR